MKTLDISIRKAKITSFSVDLNDEGPRVNATIALLTEGGKEITRYSIGSSHWEDNLKFNIPVEMVGPILDIARVLEGIVTEHCQNTALRIEAPRPVPAEPLSF